MKLLHVTIMTAKLDESVDFYESIVGLTIRQDLRGNADHKLVFLSNASGDVCVELVDRQEGFYEGSGVSMGFLVDDAVAYRQELQEKGYAVGELISPNPHATFFFVKDPNNFEIQFVQED